MAASLDLPAYVSPARHRLLTSLARYRFLTVSQLLRLDIAANRHRLYALLRDLEASHLVKRQRNNRLNSEPDIFFLSKPGARAMAELDGEPVDAPHGINVTGEIWHRMAIIDAHISLRLWAEAQAWHVDFVKTDFVRSGAVARKATTTPTPGPPYVPDAIAQVTGPDELPRLLVFEIYRRGAEGLHHFRRQIGKVQAAAAAHVVEKHHNIAGSAARYLITFTDTDARRKACATLADPAGSAWRQFFFADHPALVADFAMAWHDAAGTPRPLFVAQ